MTHLEPCALKSLTENVKLNQMYLFWRASNLLFKCINKFDAQNACNRSYYQVSLVWSLRGVVSVFILLQSMEDMMDV